MYMKLIKSFCHNYSKKAFTLVEILLAVAIIGALAVLVVPAAVTKYQQKTFDTAYEKYMTQLTELLDRLPMIEGVSSFGQTSMYLDVENNDHEHFTEENLMNSAGKFLKDNFKYIGTPEYSENEYELTDDEGNHLGWRDVVCVDLKNNTHLCIAPQTQKTPIYGSFYLKTGGRHRALNTSFDLNMYDTGTLEVSASGESEPLAP